MKLILASQSKGRGSLLRGAGYRFLQIPSHEVEPAPAKGENLKRHVLALALLKARAVARRYPRAIVIGADTALILDGKIIGKPASLAAARRMLTQLGRRPHRISSAACVIIPPTAKGGKIRVVRWVESATVTLRKWSPDRIRRYVTLTHPLGWAGAYAIQDPYSAAIVERIDGDIAPVIGLPMKRLTRVLEKYRSRDDTLCIRRVNQPKNHADQARG